MGSHKFHHFASRLTVVIVADDTAARNLRYDVLVESSAYPVCVIHLSHQEKVKIHFHTFMPKVQKVSKGRKGFPNIS
jgi:hypothetical protein